MELSPKISAPKNIISIKTILKKHNFRPLKHLGQNFLIDKKALQKIIQAADLSPADTILEIGPGLGILTKELAKRAKKVMAVEKDKRLIGLLKEVLKDYRNVEITEGDILDLGMDLGTVPDSGTVPKSFKVVANLPFYIASPIIRLFLETKNPPEVLVLMVQKEVAQRICAQPPKMSLLAVSVQFYADPKIISYVSRKSFWPRPKVDSAIIKIIPRLGKYPSTSVAYSDLYSGNKPLLSERGQRPSRRLFFKIVRAGFSSPRKQLANNLSKKLNIDKEKIKKALLACGLNPEIRAEGLLVEDWLNLTKLFFMF